LIELVAAFHLTEPDFVACDREILIAQEVAQPGVHRIDLFGLRGVGLGQPLNVFSGEVVREDCERSHKLRIFNWYCQLCVELRDHVVDRKFGFDHTAFHAITKLRDRTVGDRDVIIVTPEIVFVIGQGLEWSRPCAASKVRVECVKSGEVIDRAHFC